MADMICNANQFREKLDVGDVFWRMTSCRGEPRTVQGPCTILEFSADETGLSIVTYAHMLGRMVIEEDRSLHDLTDEYHGVFVNKADAERHLAQQKAVYANDPLFVARLMRQKTETSLRAGLMI